MIAAVTLLPGTWVSPGQWGSDLALASIAWGDLSRAEIVLDEMRKAVQLRRLVARPGRDRAADGPATGTEQIAQAFLGAKIHDPKDPGADLGPMFTQVVGTLLTLARKNADIWRPITGSREVPVMVGLLVVLLIVFGMGKLAGLGVLAVILLVLLVLAPLSIAAAWLRGPPQAPKGNHE